MSNDSNQNTKLPALNARKAPKGEDKGSMAHRGYERLDGGKRESADGYLSSDDRKGLSQPVYPQPRVYDDY